MNDKIVEAAGRLAKATAKTAIAQYQQELLLILEELLKQDYKPEHILKELIKELGKPAT